MLSVVVGLIWMHDLPFMQMSTPLLLVLLMSAVPVALPVMFTVSMALGWKESGQAGGIGDATQRRGGCGNHRCALRRQNRHDHY